MEIQFKRKIGETEFTFLVQAETHEQFFKQVQFYTKLPTTGPNGENDLELRYRKTPKEGYEYFSIVSPSAKKEFKFGQSQQEPGSLFEKGWEDLYEGNAQQNNAPVGAPVQNNTPVGAPVQNQQAPVQQAQAPAPAAAPVQQAPAQQAQAPAQNQQVNNAPAPAAPPQNNAAVNDIMANFLNK